MEIDFDPKAEAVYIRIAKSNAQIHKTEEAQKDRVFVDKDRKGNILGIEVLHIRKFEVGVIAS